jgi:hypothetical protein
VHLVKPLPAQPGQHTELKCTTYFNVVGMLRETPKDVLDVGSL